MAGPLGNLDSQSDAGIWNNEGVCVLPLESGVVWGEEGENRGRSGMRSETEVWSVSWKH